MMTKNAFDDERDDERDISDIEDRDVTRLSLDEMESGMSRSLDRTRDDLVSSISDIEETVSESPRSRRVVSIDDPVVISSSYEETAVSPESTAAQQTMSDAPEAYVADEQREDFSSALAHLEDDAPATSPSEASGLDLADPRGPVASTKSPTPADRPIDMGLPTEDEIRTERGLDVARGLVGGISNALRAFSGASPREIDFRGRELDDRRRAGINQRLTAKGETEARRDEAARSAEAEERVARIRREPTSLDMAREERLLRDSESRDSLSSRRLDLLAEQLEDRELQAEYERSTDEEMRDPSSDISERARARLDLLMEGLPDRVREAMTDGRDLSQFSAQDVQRMEDRMAAFTRSRQGRMGSGGAGARGASSDDAMINQIIAAGVQPDYESASEYYSAVGPRGAIAAINSSINERVAGGLNANEPIPGIRVTVPMSAGQRQQFVDDYGSVRRSMSAFGDISRIARERSAAERVISPEVASEIAPHFRGLLSMVAQIQGTGVINPSEMPAIMASLPDPSSISGMTFDAFDASLREWRRRLESNIRLSMEDAGVSEEGISTALRRIRSAGGVSSGRASARGGESGGESSSDVIRVRRGGREVPMRRSLYESLDPSVRDTLEVVE